MPCNGGDGGVGRYGNGTATASEALREVGRVCCDMRTVLRRHKLEGELCAESLGWIARHDAEDARRIKDEEEQGERTRARRAALSKLTMDEQRLLGL